MDDENENEIDMRKALFTVDAAAAALASLNDQGAKLAIQRRIVLQGEHTLVKRDPRDMASAIALGFVCVRLGLRAADSWRLEGLFSETIDEVIERLRVAARHFDGNRASAGAVFVRALDLGSPELAAKGEYEAWHRRALKYFEEHEAWLSLEPEVRNSGSWRVGKMSRDQQELIRQTCAILEMDLPGHMNCGTAHDWLAQFRANLAYRGAGA